MANLGYGSTSWQMWQSSDQSGNSFDIGGIFDPTTGAMGGVTLAYTPGLTIGEGALFNTVYATQAVLTCNVIAEKTVQGRQLIATGGDTNDMSLFDYFELAVVGDAFISDNLIVGCNVTAQDVYTGYLNPYESIMDPSAIQTYHATTSNVWQFNWLSNISPYATPGTVRLYYGSNSSGMLRTAVGGVDYPLSIYGGVIGFGGYTGSPNDIYSGSNGCMACNVWLTYSSSNVYFGEEGGNVVIHSGNIATYAPAQIQSDWTQGTTTALDYIKHKPSLAAVATSGLYTDVSGRPTLAAVATSGLYTDVSGRPTLATVATSGLYTDISGRPALATVATSGLYTDISGKPVLKTVATSGLYSDLSGCPTIGNTQWTTVDSTHIKYAGYVAGNSFSGAASNLTWLDYNAIYNWPITAAPVHYWLDGTTCCYNSVGSVGIGTSSPAGLLTVWCPNNGTGVEISGPSNTGNGSQPFLYFKRYNGSGTVSTTASIMSGGYDGAGGLTFGTNGASTAMIINAAGNVGIGTTSPSSKLHINGGTQTLTNGDSSYTIYGPNTTYSGYLTVGSAIGAQNGTAHAMVCCDNGNLHLSAGNATGTCIYLNFYSQSGSIQSWSPWTHHSTLSCGALYASTVSSSTQYVANGNTSYTQYGPNSTWGAYLSVGAGDPTPWVATGASVATTNGNLHLDSKTGCAIYLNWYATSTSINSKTYWTHNDSMNITGSLVTGGNVATMANDSAFGYPIAGGQTTALQAYNTVGWIGGAFTGTGGGDRVVIGNLSGNGYIGAHNHALTAWAVLVVNNATVYAASDSNLKENIEAADTQICYDSIKSVPLVRFNYNSNIAPGLITEDKRVTGILAQDLEIIFPKSVRVIDSGSNIYPTDGMKSINLDQVNYTMIGAVQQLMGMVESLTSNVSVLSARITALSG